MRRKLQDNLRSVRDRIAAACGRVHRNPESVQLVAVTKTVGIDVIRTLAEMGVTDFGENRAQELIRRAAMMKEVLERRKLCSPAAPLSAPRWHMVGNLQRNKVKALLPWTVLIHSVDRLRLGEEISKHAAGLDRPVDALLEVNGGSEPQKSGVPVCAAPHLAEQIASLPGIRLRGLMTMAPLDADARTLENAFSRVGELFDEMRKECRMGDVFDTFSAGMSGDFEIAVQCGATMVRVGSALLEGIESLGARAEAHGSGVAGTLGEIRAAAGE